MHFLELENSISLKFVLVMLEIFHLPPPSKNFRLHLSKDLIFLQLNFRENSKIKTSTQVSLSMRNFPLIIRLRQTLTSFVHTISKIINLCG